MFITLNWVAMMNEMDPADTCVTLVPVMVPCAITPWPCEEIRFSALEEGLHLFKSIAGPHELLRHPRSGNFQNLLKVHPGILNAIDSTLTWPPFLPFNIDREIKVSKMHTLMEAVQTFWGEGVWCHFLCLLRSFR